MDDFLWYFGFAHFVLYGALGLSFIAYLVLRNIGGIAKVIYKNRDSIVPRFE